MDRPTLTLICSFSGLLSLAITFLTLFVVLGKYKQKVDTHDQSISILENEMKELSKLFYKEEKND
jgi:hypothetical protein